MAKNQSNDSEPKVLLDEEAILDDIVASPYKYGFTTDLETEEFEKGLSQGEGRIFKSLQPRPT